MLSLSPTSEKSKASVSDGLINVATRSLFQAWKISRNKLNVPTRTVLFEKIPTWRKASTTSIVIVSVKILISPALPIPLVRVSIKLRTKSNCPVATISIPSPFTSPCVWASKSLSSTTICPPRIKIRPPPKPLTETLEFSLIATVPRLLRLLTSGSTPEVSNTTFPADPVPIKFTCPDSAIN